MNFTPLPHPNDAITANLNRQIDQFFGSGGKAEPAPAFKPKQRPPRTDKIDPETVLKRRRPSPSHAERIALRRTAESL